ncbi:chymotrypsinogen A-like [Ruditapes philippinarum]|uniref:chymotrypsinogen A-like n=1 Tax=Ruditapes philippinarum TaxID=129788 RepID=UPI00295BA5F4|nr:chymotrypsinogen A-like [Ruditapes philippinarum]
MGTMVIVYFICLIAVLQTAGANICNSFYHGTCYDLYSGLNGACTAGHVYTLNYCGVYQMCCYYQTTHYVTSAPLTSAPFWTHAPTAPVWPPANTAFPSSSGSKQCGTSLVGSTAHRIVGGSYAQLGEFPWQVSLRFYGQHVCGGTLINDQWVVTASHCFKERGHVASQWQIALGVKDQRFITTANTVHVESIHPHEFFDKTTNNYDIALMKLSKRIDVTGRLTRPACLPQPADQFPADMCIVSGWGTTYYDPTGHAKVTDQLEYINLRTISNAECSYYMGASSVRSTNICAGVTQTGGKGPCLGDSGGPLICKRDGVWKLAGVVSWGTGCGEARKPGVYTRVTQFLSWIENKMNLYG